MVVALASKLAVPAPKLAPAGFIVDDIVALANTTDTELIAALADVFPNVTPPGSIVATYNVLLTINVE